MDNKKIAEQLIKLAKSLVGISYDMDVAVDIIHDQSKKGQRRFRIEFENSEYYDKGDPAESTLQKSLEKAKKNRLITISGDKVLLTKKGFEYWKKSAYGDDK